MAFGKWKFFPAAAGGSKRTAPGRRTAAESLLLAAEEWLENPMTCSRRKKKKFSKGMEFRKKISLYTDLHNWLYHTQYCISSQYWTTSANIGPMRFLYLCSISSINMVFTCIFNIAVQCTTDIEPIRYVTNIVYRASIANPRPILDQYAFYVYVGLIWYLHVCTYFQYTCPMHYRYWTNTSPIVYRTNIKHPPGEINRTYG